MTKEATNKKTKKSAKVRQKQRLIALIALVGVLILITIVLAVHLYQKWDARYDSKVSVLFIEEDGKVVTNDVVTFDTSKYDQTELEQFIEETISTYNRDCGEDVVVQKSLEVENNTASLILTYKNANIYEDFSGSELFVGTISEAVAAGYSFDGQFASLVNGKAVESSLDKFYGQTDLKVAIIRSNIKVQVDGEILYVSAENVINFGENWIVTKDGANLLGNAASNDTEGTETGTQTETESGTDEVDGSVDEPVGTEEESTEIIFDFGDEEKQPNAEDNSSEVYTYIIYK